MPISEVALVGLLSFWSHKVQRPDPQRDPAFVVACIKG